MTLPIDAKGREQWPIYDYIYGYFPDALMEEIRVSWIGNQQHNPGEKMHWARDKSSDHMNKALRHIDDYARGTQKDVDGTYHLAKAIWRLKARLQLDIEAERATVARVEGDGGLVHPEQQLEFDFGPDSVGCCGDICGTWLCWRRCGHSGAHMTAGMKSWTR
jgi:hypothetical protein